MAITSSSSAFLFDSHMSGCCSNLQDNEVYPWSQIAFKLFSTQANDFDQAEFTIGILSFCFTFMFFMFISIFLDEHILIVISFHLIGSVLFGRITNLPETCAIRMAKANFPPMLTVTYIFKVKDVRRRSDVKISKKLGRRGVFLKFLCQLTLDTYVFS